jgi:hypothetical protein
MHLLGALTWDPQIRGALIVLTAFLILPGSVYLLLATNIGARVGFLLAVAGLSGWLAVMGIVWMVFGIGLKGREPTWKPKEMITGSLDRRTTLPAMFSYPNGWKVLKSDNPRRGDASSAADRVFVPSSAKQPGKEAKPLTPEQQARFKSPFTTTSDYLLVDAREKGGDNEVFTIRHHKFYFRHSPHYVVIRVQPVLVECASGQASTSAAPCLPPLALGAAPRQPEADPTKPLTTLIMARDLGSIRFPPFLVALSSLLIFGVTTSALHERDKEIMRARGQIPATA